MSFSRDTVAAGDLLEMQPSRVRTTSIGYTFQTDSRREVGRWAVTKGGRNGDFLFLRLYKAERETPVRARFQRRREERYHTEQDRARPGETEAHLFLSDIFLNSLETKQTQSFYTRC